MNLASGLLLAGMGAAYSSNLDLAQWSITNSVPPQLSVRAVQNYTASSALLLRSGAYSNDQAVVILKRGRPTRALKGSSTNPPILFFVITNAAFVPKPGVYKTEPYAGIVIVPDKHPDDRAIVNVAQGDLGMPIIKPDLRFIPLKPASK